MPLLPYLTPEEFSRRCSGMTSTHKAIRLALDKVNGRKAEYQANSVSYRQPWIWLFTDDKSNDTDNGSYAEFLQLQNDRLLSFYAVGIGDESEASELKGMHKNNMMLRVPRENFKAAFDFLSTSLSHAGKSQPGEKKEPA